MYSAALQVGISAFLVGTFYTVNAVLALSQIDKAKAKGALKEIGIAKVSNKPGC